MSALSQAYDAYLAVYADLSETGAELSEDYIYSHRYLGADHEDTHYYAQALDTLSTKYRHFRNAIDNISRFIQFDDFGPVM